MEGVDEDTALQAPQAILLSTIMKGIFDGDMKRNLFIVSMTIGVVVVTVDETLGHFTRFHPSFLAVGMDIYPNITTISIIVIGTFVRIYYDRWAQGQVDSERFKRLEVLLVAGLIVGDFLLGILNAGVIGGTSNPDAFAVIPDSFEDITKIVGLVIFIGIIALSYRWVQVKGRNAVEPVS